MLCKNIVSYYVPRGYHYKEVTTKCGNTDYYGERAICDDCYNDPGKMRWIEQQEELSRLDNETARSAGWGEY